MNLPIINDWGIWGVGEIGRFDMRVSQNEKGKSIWRIYVPDKRMEKHMRAYYGDSSSENGNGPRIANGSVVLTIKIQIPKNNKHS